jgi:hypothetical protein
VTWPIEHTQRGARLQLEGLQQPLQRHLALALVAPQDQGIEQAVAEGMPAQRLPAPLALRGEQRSASQCIEVLADHGRIEERGAVLAHQRRDLGQRVDRHDRGVRLEHRGHRTHQFQLRREAQFMRAHHHLAHVG